MLLGLERDIFERLALGRMTEAWLHRAVRETDAGLLHGRQALMAATARELAVTGPQEIAAAAELPGFLAATIVDAQGRRWRRHRWVTLEAGRIAAETLVADLHPSAVAPGPRWPALGELESGRGQRPAPAAPDVADDIPAPARDMVTAMHRAVNARRFDRAAAAFAPDGRWDGPGGAGGAPDALAPALVRLVAAAPDLAATLDRTAADEGRVAALWRVAGTAHGTRFAGFVSCLATLDDGAITRLDVVCDPDGMMAAARAPELTL